MTDNAGADVLLDDSSAEQFAKDRRSADRSQFSSRLNWWMSNNATSILVVVVVITLLAMAQLVDLQTGTLRLRVDPSLEAISTQSAEDRAYADTVRQRFGDSEGILVLLETGDIYTADSLRLVASLSSELAALDGVRSISSIASTSIPVVQNDELNYMRVDESALADPEFPQRLRRSTEGNPILEGQLVSADGRAAAILVTPEDMSERELLESRLSDRIIAVADSARNSEVGIFVTGTPVIRSAISETVSLQLRKVVPAITLIVTVLLAFAFPSWYGVFIPLATITITMIWTMAALSVTGMTLNLVTSLVPPFLITMGLAYCGHILSDFQLLARESDPRRPIARNATLYKNITGPILITGFATTAGLLALLLNAQRAMMEFAWLSVLGTIFLCVVTLTFVPALLCKIVPGPKTGQGIVDKLFDILGDKIVALNQGSRKNVIIGACATFVVAMLLATQIRIGDAFVGIFPESARVRADYNQVNEVLGGVSSLDIVLEGAGEGLFTDPRVLQSLDELQGWIRVQPEVGSVTGLVDHVRMLNRYLANSENTLPESRNAVTQMMFVGDGDILRSVVNADRSSTLIRTRLLLDDSGEIAEFITRLQNQFSVLPPGLEASVIGSAAVMAESVSDATSGQLNSVILSLTLIFLCLSLQFMSFKIGLQASLPTVLQTALYFGALGMLGVPLNPTTILVECLVLGLAIDDTIHYLARFNATAKRTGSEEQGAITALRVVLRPVTLTKAILAIGFLTLVTGELRNQALFGWLAALTLALAWLVDVRVTPSFMRGLHIVSLWDTLRIKLGSNIQKTIPLLAGLSNRQARIFALMANMETFNAGTRIVEAGDDAGFIYVVIEGQISILRQVDGKELEVARMGRGSIVGERGYFGQKRNATIVALTNVRMLKFDYKDQERICKSYPQIAARVFLALNRLQAERHY